MVEGWKPQPPIHSPSGGTQEQESITFTTTDPRIMGKDQLLREDKVEEEDDDEDEPTQISRLSLGNTEGRMEDATFAMLSDITGWEEEEPVDDDVARVFGLGKKGASYKYASYDLGGIPSAGSSMSLNPPQCLNGVCYNGQETRKTKSARPKSKGISRPDSERANFDSVDRTSTERLSSSSRSSSSSTHRPSKPSSPNDPSRTSPRRIANVKYADATMSQVKAREINFDDGLLDTKIGSTDPTFRPITRSKSAMPRFSTTSNECGFPATLLFDSRTLSSNIWAESGSPQQRLRSARKSAVRAKTDFKPLSATSEKVMNVAVITGRRYCAEKELMDSIAGPKHIGVETKKVGRRIGDAGFLRFGIQNLDGGTGCSGGMRNKDSLGESLVLPMLNKSLKLPSSGILNERPFSSFRRVNEVTLTVQNF